MYAPNSSIPFIAGGRLAATGSDSTIALLIGRALIITGAMLVGIVMRSSAGRRAAQ
jgi:hypothetical protein